MYALQTEPGQLQRLGIIMEPDLADPREAGGVLNPAASRGPDGALYLLHAWSAPATIRASAWPASSTTARATHAAWSDWAWCWSPRSPTSAIAGLGAAWKTRA